MRTLPFHIYQFRYPGSQKVCFLTWLEPGSGFDSWNLMKRSITYTSWCFMCKSSGVDHLLLHCHWVSRLFFWLNTFRWFGLQWVVHAPWGSLFNWTFRRMRRNQKVWDITPLAPIYCMEKEKQDSFWRNRTILYIWGTTTSSQILSFWCTHEIQYVWKIGCLLSLHRFCTSWDTTCIPEFSSHYKWN